MLIRGDKLNVSRALAQISEIHGHLARTEVYRGCRAVPVALTGVLALLGGVLQPWAVDPAAPQEFVRFWVEAACISIALVSAEIGWHYWFCADLAARRVTKKVLAQFLPCVAAGAVTTAALARLGDGFVPVLPGAWAVLFSMGMLAARPYLPRAIGWVALFYFAAGASLLWIAPQAASLSRWCMASVFGVGQLLAALVLYWNLERRDDA